MAISGVGQSYYQNNVETTKRAKSVNSTKETNGFAGKVTEKNSIFIYIILRVQTLFYTRHFQSSKF